jgi:hypothetical protein
VYARARPSGDQDSALYDTPVPGQLLRRTAPVGGHLPHPPGRPCGRAVHQTAAVRRPHRPVTLAVGSHFRQHSPERNRKRRRARSGVPARTRASAGRSLLWRTSNSERWRAVVDTPGEFRKLPGESRRHGHVDWIKQSNMLSFKNGRFAFHFTFAKENCPRTSRRCRRNRNCAPHRAAYTPAARQTD